MRSPRALRTTLLALAATSALVLSACGSDGGDAFGGGGDSGGDSGSGATVVVGAQAFTEAKIMQEMYRLLLEDAGFTVTTRNAERAILTDALKSGEVDVIPDYLGSTLNFLGNQVNSTESETYSSPDTDQEVTDFKAIGEKIGITALDPAEAQDQNSFFVTQKFAEANGNITTLSDLAGLNKKLTLGADTFCGADTQPYCINGLKETYGLDLTLDDSYQFGAANLLDDVASGKVDLGETGTTDATLEAKGLLALEDDKQLQPAENLTPFINVKDASDEKIAAALNKLAPVLTTEDLTALNGQFSNERKKEADIAQEYLESKGLIG